MKLSLGIKKLEPRTPFRIARGEKSFVENVFLSLEEDGLTGYGEASPNKFYDETAENVTGKLAALPEIIKKMSPASIDDIARIWLESWRYLKPSRAAQCALDIALWDLLGKKLGKSVSNLIWNTQPKPLSSSCTLGICSSGSRKDKIRELRDVPIIKVKMDQTADLSILRDLRLNTTARLWVDANCSWSGLLNKELLDNLKALNTELLEQPLPPGNNMEMSEILKSSALDIIADESCVSLPDIEKLKGKFSGINIKLVKCGGLTPGMKMLSTARKQGFKIMVGCMLESNLLISAGAALAQEADFVDLDGCWLLKEEGFEGTRFKQGVLTPGTDCGFGVHPETGWLDMHCQV